MFYRPKFYPFHSNKKRRQRSWQFQHFVFGRKNKPENYEQPVYNLESNNYQKHMLSVYFFLLHFLHGWRPRVSTSKGTTGVLYTAARFKKCTHNVAASSTWLTYRSNCARNRVPEYTRSFSLNRYQDFHPTSKARKLSERRSKTAQQASQARHDIINKRAFFEGWCGPTHIADVFRLVGVGILAGVQ